jgi:hypothetical protein
LVSDGNKENQGGGEFGNGIHGGTWKLSKYGNIAFNFETFVIVLDALIQRPVDYLGRMFVSDASGVTILLKMFITDNN